MALKPSASARAIAQVLSPARCRPLFVEGFDSVEPVYEDMPGWKESTVGVTRYDQLPGNAQRYLERMQAVVGVPVDIISTGPDRDQTIILNHPFA